MQEDLKHPMSKMNSGIEDSRAEYMPPELTDHGNVSELTQSAFNTGGADGGYS